MRDKHATRPLRTVCRWARRHPPGAVAHRPSGGRTPLLDETAPEAAKTRSPSPHHNAATASRPLIGILLPLVSPSPHIHFVRWAHFPLLETPASPAATTEHHDRGNPYPYDPPAERHTLCRTYELS